MAHIPNGSFGMWAKYPGPGDPVALRAHAVPSTGFTPGLVSQRGMKMLEIIAVILIVLWLLGMVSSVTMKGFIHILLIVAVIIVLVRLINRRRVA